MCWSKEVSFLSLAVGTCFNYILWSTYPAARQIAYFWQFILLMQLFEGLSWIGKSIRSPHLSFVATVGAFLFNVTQPLFSTAVMFSNMSTPIQYVAVVLCTVYTGLVIKGSWNKKFLPLYSSTCRHLQLYWWSKWVDKSAYFLFCILFLISAITYPTLGPFLVAFLFVTGALSANMYRCSYGGIWCWFAAFGPVATYLYLHATSKAGIRIAES